MHCCLVHKSIMGNIVQCCDTLSNYFKCKDAPAQAEAERSPLLSSEESECDSPSLSDDTSVTNPALEPEHFMFPDIILSSSLGGDVTLVEPMVCLLVSEEEDGLGDLRDDRQEKSKTGRHRGYSEVETQTEGETHIGMGVQTQMESQAEVQTQTERPVCNNETTKKEVKTLTNTGTRKEMEEHEILKQVAVLSEAQTDTHTSQQGHLETVTNMLSEKLNIRIVDSATWSEKEERQSENNKLDPGDTDKEAKEEKLKEDHVHEHAFYTELKEMLNKDEGDDFKLQQHITVQENTYFPRTERRALQTLVNVKEEEQNVHLESTSVMPTEHDVNDMIGNIVAVASQKKPTRHSINNTDNVENFNPAECRVATTQHNHDNEQMGEATVGSDQNVTKIKKNIIPTTTNRNLSEDHTDKTLLKANRIQSQDEKTDLQHVVELEIVLPQLEQEGEEMKQMTLFLVDRMFLAPSHVKGV